MHAPTSESGLRTWNLLACRRVWPTMKTRNALALLIVAAPLVLGACSSIGGQPSGSQGPASTSTADPNAIYHRTGATDVVLRFEEGGGFVPMGFFAT
ncbi:MAG: hypothetical protein ABI555_10690, partial [Chloroflexota bacterium]